MASDQHSTQLRDYLWLVKRRKWEIIVVAALTFVVTVGITLLQTDVYEGTTRVLVNGSQGPNGAAPQTPNMPTEQQVADSPPVAVMVIKSLGLKQSPNQLLGNLHVSTVPNTNVLQIAYDSPSKQTAAKVANGFANAYVQYRASAAASLYTNAIQKVTRSITITQTRLAALEQQIASAPSAQVPALQNRANAGQFFLSTLRQQLATLQADSTTSQTNAAQVLQAATVPGSPVRPQKLRNAILGLVAGLVLGLLVALFRQRLDIRLKSPDEFEQELGTPILGVVPRRRWSSEQDAVVLRTDPHSPDAEVYRTIATNIAYQAGDRGIRAILVTSALRGEGKSTVSANVAVALAQSDKRVLLVSADLRRPRIHRFFGARNEGLLDVIRGAKPVEAAWQSSGTPNLWIIGAGAPPADPAGLLGSHDMNAFFEAIRAFKFDFVIVDAPPALAVADASIMTRYTDAVLFVVDASNTSRLAMARARDQLKNAGATVIGGVYNNFNLATGYPGDYYSHAYAARENTYADREVAPEYQSENGAQEPAGVTQPATAPANPASASPEAPNGRDGGEVVYDTQASPED